MHITQEETSSQEVFRSIRILRWKSIRQRPSMKARFFSHKTNLTNLTSTLCIKTVKATSNLLLQKQICKLAKMYAIKIQII
jgi:hypothetical protein